MEKRIPNFDEFINEFGPMHAPQRGSTNSNIKRISYPVEKIKVGDTLKAIRNGLTSIVEKKDKIEIVDIKTAKELGSYGNSLVFFVKVNDKLNVYGDPYIIDQSEMELVLGK